MSNSTLIGQQLDEYHILSQLGEGGMSTIYLGLDIRLHRYTAIKVIHSLFQSEPDSVERFNREAQAVARLDHPNIVRLYHYGQSGDVLYMAMQHIEGADLRVILNNYRQDRELIPPNDAARIVREICQALDYAHENGVLHRDVKPSNIMLDQQGKATLTDFGLALLAEVDTEGKAYGTPQYMSPEQVKSPALVGPQSDLYSVGVILYEMFTGEIPFHEIQNPMDLVAHRSNTEPPSPRILQPDISTDLEAVILKALALDPAERFQSGADLTKALDKALPAVFVPAAPVVVPLVDYVASEVTQTKLPEAGAVSLPRPPAVPDSQPSAGPAIRPVAVPPIRPPIPARQPASRPARRRAGLPIPLIALAGCAVFFLVAVVVVVGGVQLIRGQLASPYRSWLPLTLANEQLGQPALPAAYPAGTASAADYLLQILTNGEDSLYLVNIGQTAVPLAALRFEAGQDSFDGSQWGVTTLEPGNCVSLWKDRGNPQPPAVACNEVGSRIERPPNHIFWKEAFNIYYGGTLITTCPGEGCQLLIPAP